MLLVYPVTKWIKSSGCDNWAYKTCSPGPREFVLKHFSIKMGFIDCHSMLKTKKLCMLKFSHSDFRECVITICISIKTFIKTSDNATRPQAYLHTPQGDSTHAPAHDFSYFFIKKHIFKFLKKY